MRLLSSVVPDAPVTLLRLEGRLDWAASAVLEGFATERRARRPPHDRGLVLDLGGLEFCDSLGLGVLVALANHERDAGAELVVCGVRPAVRRTLEATRLHTIFLLFDDTETAVRWLASAPAWDDMAPANVAVTGLQ